MLPVKFHCPHCQSPLEFDEADAGLQRFCIYCGETVTVPFPPAEFSTATEIPPPFQAPGAGASGMDSPNAAAGADYSQRTSAGASQQQRASAGAGAAGSAQNFFDAGARQAKTILKDLGEIPIQQEMLPIDSTNIQALLRDFVFWAVTLLGIIPLLIITVQDPQSQLTMFALFFAFVWGVIFKKFILNDPGTWRLPVASLFFTGVVGIWLLLFIYRWIMPNFYLTMADSQNPVVSLFGFIFQVGLWEEIIKAVPVFIALSWFKNQLKPLTFVTIGVFSGLGFAAFENLHYGETAISSAYQLTRTYDVEGLVSGVQNAMVMVMLRSVSLVFCHAVFSGIVAYFITTAYLRREKVGALILLGIVAAAFLHGLYDWLAGIQPTLAALLAGFSFALFYGYLSKLRNAMQLASS